MSEEIMAKYYFEKDFLAFEKFITNGKYFITPRSYKAGATICSQGETLNNGYYIRKGIMQLKIGTAVGKEKTIAFFGPGSIFPLGVNEHHYAMEYAMTEEAFTDIEVYQFQFPELRRMAKDNYELSLRMIEHYCDFVSFLFYELASLSYNNAFVKVVNVLSVFNEKVSRNGVIELNQEQLAEIAGVSKIQVARAYKRLVDEGVIKVVRNGARVTDQEALRRYKETDIIGE